MLIMFRGAQHRLRHFSNTPSGALLLCSKVQPVDGASALSHTIEGYQPCIVCGESWSVITAYREGCGRPVASLEGPC